MGLAIDLIASQQVLHLGGVGRLARRQRLIRQFPFRKLSQICAGQGVNTI